MDGVDAHGINSSRGGHVNIKQKIAALGVGVALLGGGSAIALATSAPSSAATAPPATAPAQGQGQGRGAKAGALMRRVVHGDLTVRTKNGFEKATYDRGTVTAKSGDSFTLQRPDNVSVTIKVSDTTKYRGIQSFDQLQVNKPAIVLSQAGTAQMVGQRTGNGTGPKQPAAAAA
jgi:hypothetical protein